jgi:hypothetical protein
VVYARALSPSHRGIALFVVLALAVIVLIAVDADGVLDYLRVLAWPLVAVLALLIFKGPLLRLLGGLYLEEVNWRGSKLRFGARPQPFGDEEFVPVFDDEDQDAPEHDDLEMYRTGANVAGALLQAYQMQIDFLDVLARAPNGLSSRRARRGSRSRSRKCRPTRNNGLLTSSWDGWRRGA